MNILKRRFVEEFSDSVYVRLKETPSSEESEEMVCIEEVACREKLGHVGVILITPLNEDQVSYKNMWSGEKTRVHAFIHKLPVEHRRLLEIGVVSKRKNDLNFISVEEFLFRIKNHVSLELINRDEKDELYSEDE